jgi:glycosyltransferase involved in cell wall biosynthesis
VNVLVVARSLPAHHLGGMETLAADLVNAFASGGASAHVLTTPSSRPLGLHPSVNVHVVDAAPGVYSRAWWRGARAFAEGMWTANGPILSVSVAARSMLEPARRWGVPVVMQAHGTAWAEIKTKLASRELLRTASAVRNGVALARDLVDYQRYDRVVAVGASVSRALRCGVYRSIPRDRVVEIPNGVPTDVFRPDWPAAAETRAARRWTEDAFVVATAGRLHPTKGFDDLIEAIADVRRRLKPRPTHLVIMGDGADRDRLETHALRCGVEVTFTGALLRAEVARTLVAADLFVCPSRRLEGLPLAVLEALACGVPCIVTDTVELGADLVTAAVVARRDVPGLAGAITAAALEPHRRVSLLPAAYRLGACATRYLEVLGA